VAARLAGVLGKDRVFLWPRDTRKYGAQTNMQGRAVATIPGATFLHIEMSHSLRHRLRKDGELRRAFIAAILGNGNDAAGTSGASGAGSGGEKPWREKP
jgi:hypothetical protein